MSFHLAAGDSREQGRVNGFAFKGDAGTFAGSPILFPLLGTLRSRHCIAINFFAALQC